MRHCRALEASGQSYPPPSRAVRGRGRGRPVLSRLLGVALGLTCLAGLAPAADTPAAPTPGLRGIVRYWEYDLAEYRHRRFYVRAAAPAGDATAVPDLAPAGRARCWAAGSAGSNPELATDGDPETYSAVPAEVPNANDLPKDLGVEWDTPQTVSQVRVSFYSPAYAPALNGQSLEYWDGQDWQKVRELPDSITGADWVWTFDPLTTTRVRLLITRFSQLRPAVRTFAVFATPVVPREATVRVSEGGLRPVLVAQGPDQPPALAVAAGKRLELLSARGHLLWEADGVAPPVITGNLEGKQSATLVVATTADLQAYDREGNRLWETPFPRASSAPGQPATVALTPLQAVDLDGDGQDEVLAAAATGALYAFDGRGRLRWRAEGADAAVRCLAPVTVPGVAGTALVVGSSGGEGRLLAGNGRVLGPVALAPGTALVGLAAADLDGDGHPEIVSATPGAVHCQTWGATTSWDLAADTDLIGLALVDLDGDQHPEVVFADRAGKVTAANASGQTLWQTPTGSPLRVLAAGDLTGEGKPELLLTATGLDLTVLDAGGRVLVSPPAALPAVADGAGLPGLMVVDLDGDGRGEVVATTDEGRLVVYRLLR